MASLLPRAPILALPLGPLKLAHALVISPFVCRNLYLSPLTWNCALQFLLLGL